MGNVWTIKIDFDKKEIRDNGNSRHKISRLSGFDSKKDLIYIITRELEFRIKDNKKVEDK